MSFVRLGFASVLAFVGAKLLLSDVYKVPIGASLGVIAALVGAGVVGSLLFPKREDRTAGDAAPARAALRGGRPS